MEPWHVQHHPLWGICLSNGKGYTEKECEKQIKTFIKYSWIDNEIVDENKTENLRVLQCLQGKSKELQRHQIFF